MSLGSMIHRKLSHIHLSCGVEYTDFVYSLEFGNNQTRDEDENNPLALPQRNPNRTRVPMSMPRSYEIVPKSMVTPGGARAYSSQADELVKRVKARAQAQKKGGKKSGLSIEGRGLY